MSYIKRGVVVELPVARVVREPDGECWLVLTRVGHGWLHGSSQAALNDKRWLDDHGRERQ